MGSVGFAFLAGILSTLSPCVLPLLPIVISASTAKHRFGPFALAAGLSFAFVGIGLFVALAGFAAGLDHAVFRAAAAVLLIAFGVVLLRPQFQLRLATAVGPVGSWAQAHADSLDGKGVLGQFTLGVLLGAVWTPCVGPTLGAASILAARAENFASVALIMTAFGIGTALPLLAVGLMSRAAMLRRRSWMLTTGNVGKGFMGLVLIAVGGLVLTGLDKRLETILVAVSPDWLTYLTTRF